MKNVIVSNFVGKIQNYSQNAGCLILQREMVSFTFRRVLNALKKFFGDIICVCSSQKKRMM